MKRITREQKKIIFIASIIVVFLICFWVFIYRPQSEKFNSIKKELKNTKTKIEEINNIIRGRDLVEAVKDLNIEFNQMVNLLILEDEDVISHLSEFARKLKIEVKDIIPSKRELFEGQVVGYDIEVLPISLSLVCEYKNLGDYLNFLWEDFPALVRIKQLQIFEEGGGDNPFLDVRLQILAYLVKEK
ncbi:MAG: hypothetical protein ABIG56_06055 [Candidatus Omnitrophota bacterium]